MRLRVLALGLLLLPVACAVDTDDDSTVDDPAESGDALTAASRHASRFHLVNADAMSATEREAVLARYADLDHTGIRDELWENAILFFDKNEDQITNKRWLSVVDFAMHSRERRFFTIDMQGGPVRKIVVAHGSGSDPNNDGYATTFSNVGSSNASSIGFYETGELYTGKHGLSMRLDGLSPTNDAARERAVVIHEAAYVNEGSARQGRSHGCLAVAAADRAWILTNLKNTIIYASN